MKWLSLRAYSRHRGCALSAVQKAIETRRISFFLIDGKKRIDPEQADSDWERNTNTLYYPLWKQDQLLEGQTLVEIEREIDDFIERNELHLIDIYTDPV